MNMDDWQLDIDTPLKAIERIAQSEDRMLAIQFFLFFSRFEYALKRLPKISDKGSGVQPDWDGYAKEKFTGNGEGVNRWQRIQRRADFLEAAEYLINEPPKKQVLKDGVLRWKERTKQELKLSMPELLVLVRAVRNNLVHGGKFKDGPIEETSRDEKLLRHSLIILSVCLEEDSDLRHWFMSDLY
jgi:hypothetical protein